VGAPIFSLKLDSIRPAIQIISASIVALAIIIEPGKVIKRRITGDSLFIQIYGCQLSEISF
jgi:hypothetical protein